MNNKWKLLLSSTALAMAAVAIPASAQDAAGASSANEIIVTARKRDESILKVPVVASVLNQETLENYQVQDLYGVATRVTGFVMSESVGTVGIQATLRGIGPTSQTPSVDQSVALNIDGLALNQGHAFQVGMFDVAQVEVLKGPQALFYGKNSPAGVISLRSADPGPEFELIGRAGYEFEADEKVGELIVSGPVNDWLGLRLAAKYSDSKGFFRNTANPLPGLGNRAPSNRRYAPKETFMVRGTAVFEPGDRYKARLKLNFFDSRMEGSGGDSQLGLCPDGKGGVPPINIPFLADADCKIDRNYQLGEFDPAFFPAVRNNGVPYADTRQYFGTLEQDLDLTDSLTLSSVTGYYKLRQANLIRGATISNPTFGADFLFRNKQFTQEVRLTSDFVDSPLNFMVGGFVQDGKIRVRGELPASTALRLPPLLSAHSHIISIWSTSAFGQAIWNITDQLELSGGARWTRETRTHDAWNDLSGQYIDVLTPRLRSSNVSPEAALTFTPTDDLTLFAAYRQGFKSGSFNTIVVASPTTRADFGDEKAKGGEVGLKARMLDRQLSVNLSAYHYIYSDLQVGANEQGPNGEIILRTINAASAKVQGIEFDFSYSPHSLEGFSLRGALNYNRARYRDFKTAPCGNGQTIAEGCNQLFNAATGRFTSQDLTGEPLVRAPDWTANLAFDYDLPLSDALTLGLSANAVYSSDFSTNLTNLPGYFQDDYIKLGATVALRGKDDLWELALIGNNLTNELITPTCSNGNSQNGTIFGGFLSGAANKGPAGSDEASCIVERGREVWLRLSLKL